MPEGQLQFGIAMAVVSIVIGVFVPEARRFLLGHAAANEPSKSWIRILTAALLLTLFLGLLLIALALLFDEKERANRADTEQAGRIVTGGASPDDGGSNTSITVTSPPERTGPASLDSVQTFTVKGCIFVRVPSGDCAIGCTPAERCEAGELPASPQHFAAFWVMRAEVTRDQYFACATAGACDEPAGDAVSEARKGAEPVTNVDLFDAQRFCGWINGRLPTEREWEYAARAGGNVSAQEAESNDEYAVVGGGSPSNVMTKRPNRFGLYDLTGNVAEWALGPSNSDGVATAVIRGGSFRSTARQLRISYRIVTDHHHVSDATGFRCVADTLHD